MVNWEEIRQEWETSKMTLADLASKHEVKLGTLKSRKSRESWTRVATVKVATKKQKDATKKKVATKKEPTAKTEIVVSDNNDLTDKQRLFVAYYVKYWNATKAYQKAYGCAYSTAMTNGNALLRNTQIKNEVIRVRDEMTSELILDKRAVLQKWIDIAFADITDYVEFGMKATTQEIPIGETEDGEIKTKKITSYYPSMSFKDSKEVDGTILSEVKLGKDGIGIKLLDKIKALDFLSKHLDLLNDNEKKRLQEEKLKTDIAKAEAEIGKISNPEQEGPIEIRIVSKKRE